MSRQWLRACSLTVGGISIIPNWSDPSAGVRVKFKVKHSTIPTPNSAIIRIYNLSKATSTLPQEGSDVELYAGYQDNIGLIFKGHVIQALRGKETPVDTYLDLVCQDGDKPYNQAVVNKALQSGSNGQDVWNVCLQAMAPFGAAAGYVTSKLSSLVYPRAQAFYGMARDTLRNLATSTDSTWFILNGAVNILGKNETTGGNVTLNPETGLIGMPVETLNGIYIRCLSNPTLKAGDTVTLDAAGINGAQVTPGITAQLQLSALSLLGTGDGTYKILAIDWSGDTRGQEWYADLTCIGAVSGTTPGSLVNQGLGGDSPPIGTR